jgi:cGMP-dependent protein kinase
MEIVEISTGTEVISQGSEGDYYYIIDSGTFSIHVDGHTVGSLNDGKGFGELALLHNTPRAATIRAETKSTIYSLDRKTFRYTIAQSQTNLSEQIITGLRKVELLSGLTEDQFNKVVNAVEVVPYKSKDCIITKGTEGNIFYMIKEGRVQVTDTGNSKFVDATLNPGDYFGERALMTGDLRNANIYATTDVVLFAIDRETFNTTLGNLSDLLSHNMNMRILSSINIFERLSKSEKSRALKSFVKEYFPIDTCIITEGDKGDKFYILLNGDATVLVGEKPVGTLTSGTYFGEMALLDDEVRKASIISTTDCECYSLDRNSFTRIMGAMQHILTSETMSRLETLHAAEVKVEGKKLIEFSNLKNMAMLGSGTFGRVTLVQNKLIPENIYALKTMRKSEVVAHRQQTNVVNEKNVMMMCNHPFVLRLFETYQDGKKLYMLLEFVQGGELFSVIHTATGDGIPFENCKFYAAGVMQGIAHLHDKDIAYRDMKPENCLVDNQGYPKVVDFGFAKNIATKSFTLCGTPEYLAPELVLGRGHNKAVDYWAFGILIYEMAAGYSPFSDPQNCDQVIICRNIVNGRVTFPRAFDPECKDLIKKLLSREIQNRLGNLKGGTDDILNHPWFKSIDHNKYMRKSLKAPWIPTVKSATDVSNFDPYDAEDDGSDLADKDYEDKENWSVDF